MLKSDLYPILEQRQQALAFSITEQNNIVSYRGLAFKHIENKKDKQDDLEMSFGDFLDSIYESGGTMQNQMRNYEKRNGQREMSENIFDAFQSENHALIEAETGTGKSLAYLIPAIYERSEEHTSELQSRGHLVCRLLLEKKNTRDSHRRSAT